MTLFTRSDDVRKGNRRRIIDAVRRKTAPSRTDIQHLTSLSPATVSAITSSLIDERVLIYPDTEKLIGAGRGRPKVALALNPDAALVGTIIFRHNIISTEIANYAGQTVAKHTTKLVTAEASPSELKKALQNCLIHAIAQFDAKPVTLDRISVGIQGVIDIAGTTLLWSPITKHQNLPIKVWLQDYFATPTHISNDCDMISQALNWREPHKYGTNFASVLLANGVGMGLFLRGRLINGTRSSGTEFGHMTYLPGGALCRCGSYGCIEAYASAYAIARRAQNAPQNTLPVELQSAHDIASIVEAAKQGDQPSLDAIVAAGDAIGTGLANIYALVDPFPIVLVGSGVVAFDLMEPAIRKSLSATVAGKQLENIPIECFSDETTLVREGCMVSALMAHDGTFAEFGPDVEAASG